MFYRRQYLSSIPSLCFHSWWWELLTYPLEQGGGVAYVPQKVWSTRS